MYFTLECRFINNIFVQYSIIFISSWNVDINVLCQIYIRCSSMHAMISEILKKLMSQSSLYIQNKVPMKISLLLEKDFLSGIHMKICRNEKYISDWFSGMEEIISRLVLGEGVVVWLSYFYLYKTQRIVGIEYSGAKRMRAYTPWNVTFSVWAYLNYVRQNHANECSSYVW